MSPADVTALRLLLIKLRWAGWIRLTPQNYQGHPEHAWRRGHEHISLWRGEINVNGDERGHWCFPALSVRCVTAVLEYAGAFGPDDERDLHPAVTAAYEGHAVVAGRWQ